jgi:uncharacterized membrane protein
VAGRSRTSNREPVERLEDRMRKVSLAISLLGLGLMSFGLIDMLVGGEGFSLQGGADALPLGSLMHLSSGPMGLMFASSGVILLGLLPAIRVILALWLYLRLKDVLSMLVAVIVLLELLLSIRLSA